jgi:PEP-CTERM motif
MKAPILLVSLFFALTVSSAFGNSIVPLPDAGGFVWINNYTVTSGPAPGNYWAIFGEAVPVGSGYDYAFSASDSTDGIDFAKGTFYYTSGAIVYSGELFNLVFNAKADTLTGLFQIPGSIHGRFVESISFPNGITPNAMTYGVLGPGYLSVSSTPEPGTLVLMGSGLCGIAGLIRRKLARN